MSIYTLIDGTSPPQPGWLDRLDWSPGLSPVLRAIPVHAVCQMTWQIVSTSSRTIQSLNSVIEFND